MKSRSDLNLEVKTKLSMLASQIIPKTFEGSKIEPSSLSKLTLADSHSLGNTLRTSALFE